MERPAELPALRVERARGRGSPLAARIAHDHETVEVRRRAGEARPAANRLRDHTRCVRWSSDDLRVDLRDEHFALADRDAAARAAHRHPGLRVGIAAIGPEDRAAVDIESEHVVRAVDHVQRAFVVQDLRLTRIVRQRARAHARAPERLQVLHVVAVQQRERRVALVEHGAAVRDPVAPRRLREVTGGERGSRSDLSIRCVDLDGQENGQRHDRDDRTAKNFTHRVTSPGGGPAPAPSRA